MGTLVITALAGLGNAALIGLINMGAEDASTGESAGPVMVLIYICTFGFFYVANKTSLREANRYVQRRLDALRLRVVGKVRHAPLRALEQIGQGETFAVIAQETNYLAQNLPLFMSAIQSAFLLTFLLLYIAVLSFPSFLVVAAFTAAALLFFWNRRAALDREMGRVHHDEAAMMDGLANFTEGFQEIRLNADKNDALFRAFTAVVDDLEAAVRGVGTRWVVLMEFCNAFLYVLAGVVIFVLPAFFDGYTDVIYKIAAAVIFSLGPVTAITSATHLYAKAETGLGHVHRIEQRLDALATQPTEPADGAGVGGFQRIDFREVTFSYRDQAGDPLFTFGPWDFSLRRGEIVFLVGGNGSGKSTATKLLCGLYRPDAGRILVDGAEVDPSSMQDYRELFAAIFPDFHLFDRLHGLHDVDPRAVDEMLARMELEAKVTFEDGQFSTTDLSTGQRKRLAMAASLLEDRDIYLFDEWAADQDPHFREIFYRELLPGLRRQGKTVIAVTHDDRYWSLCDRRLTLDFGTVRSEEAGTIDAPPAA